MIHESFYSKYKYSSPEKLSSAFCSACEKGNLDEVRYLLTSPELKEHADIHHYEDAGLSDACWHGHFDIVKYLLTSPDLKEHANLNDHKEKSCGALLNACGAGHFEIVKYLLTSSDLKEHALINWVFMPPLSAACEKGHFEIVKYLLTSPDLKEHSDITMNVLLATIAKNQIDILKYLLTLDNVSKLEDIHASEDLLFKHGIYNDARECISYLIFDMNIEMTDNIKKLLEEPAKEQEKFVIEIKDMFEKRFLAHSLSEELPNVSLYSKKKIKL
jgi:ankyrin repeat protein